MCHINASWIVLGGLGNIHTAVQSSQ